MVPREVLEILKRPQVEMVSIVYDHGAGPRFDLYKKDRDKMANELPESVSNAREITIEEFDAACRAGTMEEPMIEDGSKIIEYRTGWTVTGILNGERVKATKPGAKNGA